MTTPRRGREDGSATVWVITCCALLLLVSAVTTLRGVAVLARHRAESAADLSALAGAGQIGISTTICAAARSVARSNGAVLLACASRVAADGRTGTVRTQVGVRMDLPVLGVTTVSAGARAARLTGRTP